ncbi:hypothetical protein OG21DRAFT_1509373 [Imleria badia]|nr:hypothetical protein OG21DRAFT_1509373 [Imleria badia]
MNANVCVADLASNPITCHEDNNNNIQPGPKTYLPTGKNLQQVCLGNLSTLIPSRLLLIVGKFIIHCLCYILYAA